MNLVSCYFLLVTHVINLGLVTPTNVGQSVKVVMLLIMLFALFVFCFPFSLVLLRVYCVLPQSGRPISIIKWQVEIIVEC
jgi:hypothetical protein